MNIPSKKEIDIQTNHAIYVQFSQSWLLKEHRRSNNFNKDHPETVHLLSKWQKILTLPENSTCFNGHEIDIKKVISFSWLWPMYDWYSPREKSGKKHE